MLVTAIQASSCAKTFHVPEIKNEPDSWPETRKNSSRTASVEFEPDLPLEARWHLDIEGAFSDQNIVCNDSNLIIISSNTIHCVDTDSGETIWSRGFGKRYPHYSKIAGQVLICCLLNEFIDSEEQEDELVCLDIETGQLLWQTKIPKIDTDIEDYCLSDDKVVLVSKNLDITEVNITDGSIVKSFKLSIDKVAVGPPVMDGNSLFLATGQDIYSTNRISCTDLDGRVEWTKTYPFPVVPQCISGNSLIIVPCVFGSGPELQNSTGPSMNGGYFIYCISSNDGGDIWAYPVDLKSPWYTARGVAVSETKGVVVFGVTSNEGPTVYCLELTSGVLLWRNQIAQDGMINEPIIAGELAIVIVAHGAQANEYKLIALKLSDGSIHGAINVDGVTSVIASKDAVYTRGFNFPSDKERDYKVKHEEGLSRIIRF